MAPQYPAYQQPAQPYSYQPQQQAGGSKEIPITVVIGASIVIWILMIGGLIGYVSVAPCGFLKTALGDQNLAKLQDPNNLESPCAFEKEVYSCQGACSGRPAAKCRVWKLDVNEGCRQFIVEATTK